MAENVLLEQPAARTGGLHILGAQAVFRESALGGWHDARWCSWRSPLLGRRFFGCFRCGGGGSFIEVTDSLAHLRGVALFLEQPGEDEIGRAHV